MKKKLLLVALIIILLMTSCSKTYQDSLLALDTQIIINIFDGGDEKRIYEAFDIVLKYEGMLSKTVEDSDIYRINEKAGIEPVKVKKEVYDLIKYSIELSDATDGAFTIAVGPLVSLWGVATDKEYKPTDEEIQSILPLIDYKDIVLNENDQTVFLSKEGMSLDLGGIGKGFIADKIADYFREVEVKSAVINLGGNIYCIGQRPDGSDWNVGLQNPNLEAPDGAYYTVVTASGNKSIVTSGAYERFFEKDGEKYHHIFDPFTGYPSNSGLSSVSIIDESSTLSDALATAVFILGADKGEALIREFGVSAVMLREDKAIIRIDT